MLSDIRFIFDYKKNKESLGRRSRSISLQKNRASRAIESKVTAFKIDSVRTYRTTIKMAIELWVLLGAASDESDVIAFAGERVDQQKMIETTYTKQASKQ